MTAPEFAANTYSFMLARDARDVMEDLDFRTFELMAHPGHIWPAELDAGQRRDFQRFVKDRGMAISSLNIANVDLNIASTMPEMRAYSLGILRALLELAADLGVPGVIMSPGKANAFMPAPPQMLMSFFQAALGELAPLAAKLGTAIWIENVPSCFLFEAETLMTAIEAFGDARIGFAYDLANGYFIGEDGGAALARIGDRLRILHLSDTARDVCRHAPIGDGTMVWRDLPRLVQQARYKGPLMLEIISSDPRGDILRGRDTLRALAWS